MERKTRESVADHVQNVDTRNGAVYHANVKRKNAVAALEAHKLSPTATPASIAEHEATVTAATTRHTQRIAEWNEAKRMLADARVAAGVPAGNVAGAGASVKPAGNGASVSVAERALDKLNRLLVGITHAAAPDADWTPDARDTLVDWLLGLETFYTPAPWNEAETGIIGARAAVDALPNVPDETKALILATMPPTPTRKQSSDAPVWGKLPETIEAEATAAKLAADKLAADTLAADAAAAKLAAGDTDDENADDETDDETDETPDDETPDDETDETPAGPTDDELAAIEASKLAGPMAVALKTAVKRARKPAA